MSDQRNRDEQDDRRKAGGSDDQDDGTRKGSGDDQNDGGSDGDGDGDGEDGDAQDGAKKTPIFRRPLFWIILILVVGTLVIGGTLYYLHARQYESTDDAFVDSHIVRVAPQVGGTLVQVGDYDNRHVEAGRLLAVIQPNGPQAQLAQAQAGVVQAQAQVAQAQAQVGAAQATEAQQAAAARAPVAAAIKAEQDLARYLQLQRLDPAAVSGQQLDQARSQARQAESDAVAARRQIDNAAEQVRVARRQVGVARAGITAQRAQVAQANVTLGNLHLTAPVSGQVVNRQVNLGSYVGPGTQLMAIVPDTMWVTANFKETQLAHMRIGQGVTIKVDAFPDVTFVGHVDSVQRGAGQAFALLPAQNATGNYVKVVQRVPVRITFDVKNGPNPRNYNIGPGMSVVPSVKVLD
ncbi:MAG: HlyD family secretion protein [Janthinobacterium lividum]